MLFVCVLTKYEKQQQDNNKHLEDIMDIVMLTIIGGSIIIATGIIFLIIKLTKKQDVVIKEVPVATPEPIDLTPPADSFTPTIKSPDHKLFEKFIKQYDSGNLEFDDVPYRPGAATTCQFGIAEGYRYYVKGTNRLWNESISVDNREMRWGYVRPHMGVDRARAKDYTMQNGTVIQDPVIVPFNFNRSSIVVLGNYSYGTLISLFNDEYQFEFRVAHMNPNGDIIPWSFNRLKNRGSFDQGWLLGSSGTYGYSSGAHTHTELKSYDETCEVFDLILEEKFGNASMKEYTTQQIIKEYKKYTNFKSAPDREILKDWDAWKKKKKLLFTNKYKFTRIDPVDNKTIRTWYSTYHLFNKL